MTLQQTAPQTTAAWRCTECGVDNEVGFDLCWRCGRGTDGAPAGAEFQPESEPALTATTTRPARRIGCLRCGIAMQHLGMKKFHEGARTQPFVLLEHGSLFGHRECFDVYACPDCGKVELFLAM